MAELFRKSLMDKLSSPEQLDKMIVITPPSFWMALAGVGVMLTTAVLWSVFGRLPVNVETQGIYISEGGIYSVYSEAAGIVSRIVVEEGDIIGKGDAVAYLDSDNIAGKLEEFEGRIQKVEAVTMHSEGDVVTADNKSLIEIKGQLMTVDQNLMQNQALLELRTEELAGQRRNTAAAENRMREAEDTYYNSLNTGDSTREQVAYTEAQTALANTSGYLESSYNSLDQAKVAYAQAIGQYNNALGSYNQLLAQKSALDTVQAQRAASLQNLYDLNGWNETVEPTGVQDHYTAGDYGALPDMEAAAVSYLEAAAYYENFVKESAEAESQLLTYVTQYKLEAESAESTRNNYQNDVNTYSEQKAAASQNYEAARDNYQNRVAGLNQVQVTQNQLSGKYNIAFNEYNTEKATLNSLEDAVGQLEVQVKCDRELMEKQTVAIYSQFEATKASIIDQLRLESSQYKEQLDNCTIKASVGGRVSNISVVQGSAVNQGSQILNVQQGEEADHVVVCYVALDSGKKISEGMKVMIYPTTINRQEYGFMEATVESVASYVSSVENLRAQLGDESLVEAFLKNGPVVAVTCRLREDAGTNSGYYWSSSKGSSVSILEGTLVEASVVIEEKMPISMLLPYIKEKLTIKTEE